MVLFTSSCIILTVLSAVDEGWRISIRKRTSQKVVLVIPVKGNNGLNQDDAGGEGEKLWELGPGLEMEPAKLANVLEAKGEQGKGNR